MASLFTRIPIGFLGWLFGASLSTRALVYMDQGHGISDRCGNCNITLPEEEI